MKWGQISDDLMMTLPKPKNALTQVMTNHSEGLWIHLPLYLNWLYLLNIPGCNSGREWGNVDDSS